MGIYTNTEGVPLSVAVFLATDKYEVIPNSISVTSLIKPVRQLILSKRVPYGMRTVEVGDLIASRIGTAIHDGIEKAWTTNHEQALADLGFPKHVIDRIKINPDPKTVNAGDIPIYMELRRSREIDGHMVTGKFDFVAEGRVQDFKTTSTFTWINNTKDDDHALQGSIYRWLNPDIITDDRMSIQYIFTDWNRGSAKKDPSYPQKRVLQRMLPLLSLNETERYIRNKLSLITMYKDADEKDIPHCNDVELWRSIPTYKYYKNPQKTDRSTKNFDTYQEAHARLMQDGMIGKIITKPAEVKACRYCPAFPVCTQKDDLILAGELVF